MLKARKHFNGCEKEQSPAQMISYATDNMIVIWSVLIQGSRDGKLPNKIYFRSLLQIDMIDRPIELLLVADMFILATNRQIIFYR